mgnify:CR=1 FL=1
MLAQLKSATLLGLSVSRVDIEVDDGDIVCAGDMKFEVFYLPGHTRCCVGFYLREEGLFLSNETLGIYDGDKTILPSCLVSYSDAISSIENSCNLI